MMQEHMPRAALTAKRDTCCMLRMLAKPRAGGAPRKCRQQNDNGKYH